MAALVTDGIQKINRKSTWTSRTLGALAHMYSVNHSKTKDINENSHISPGFAQAENDDSDEDKDYDGGKIETGAPEGESALQEFAEASS